MIFSDSDRIFDTLVDTNKIYVSMKHYFKLRKLNDIGSVYLFITGSKQRERINIDIKVPIVDWDEKKQRLYPKNKYNSDINLILENVNSKITGIKTAYRLSERHLTPKILRRELKEGLPRVSFLAFFKTALDNEMKFMEPGSYKRHLSVYHKLKKFREDIVFNEIDFDLINAYKIWCKNEKNASTTISANIASIKKFLRLASKNGIKIRIDIDDIKVGSTRGNRTSLSPTEIKKLYKYYKSEFISDSNKLVAGYFLFSCMTGLRISDIQKLSREQLCDSHITFISKKTKVDQSITLNLIAQDIINHEPKLFVQKFTDPYMNRQIKSILKFLGVNKKITYHVSRHTFATSYLRAGGKVEKLKLLMGHNKIETTMVYSHIVAAEANEDIFRLDTLLI